MIACGEEDEEKSSEVLCPKLGVEEGYKCIKGSKKCEPEQIECGEEESGKASISYCPTLKVNNPSSQECVKDETDNVCIVATNCADVKLGATDDICAKLAVSDNEKCLKEGNACVVKIKCNGATGASNDDCSAYYVSDSTTKKCVKVSNENLCEEVSKSEEEIQDPSSGSSPTEPSSQAGSSPSGSSSSAGSSPTEPSSQAGSSPTKPSSQAGSSPSGSSSSAGSSPSGASSSAGSNPSSSSTKSNEITKNSSSTEKTSATVSSTKKSDEPDGAEGIKISLIILISLLMI